MDAELELLDASLPGTLPVYPGISLAGRYVLTDHPPMPRGDGMKVVSLPESRVALMVGDIVGSGALAATTMARLLTILRDRLQGGATALGAVRYADRYAASAAPAKGATIGVAVISLIDGMFEYAAAGHPPPLQVSRHGSRSISLASSRPLGTGGQGASSSGQLAPDDVLVLYTDGLLTSNAGGMADAHARILSALESASDLADDLSDQPDEVCRLLLSEVATGDRFVDDVALLVAERTTRCQPFIASGRATTNYVSQLADELEGWLDELGAGLLDHLTLRQAFTELASNVVQHAYNGSVDESCMLHIRADLSDEGVLRLQVRDDGRWRDPRNDPGRGLIIAGGLVDSLQLDRAPDGTTVTLHQELGRAVPVLQASQLPSQRTPQRADMHPSLQTQVVADRLIVTGDVEERCATEFLNSVHEATRAGTADLVIDLSGVTLLASSAIRVLFDYMERSAASGAQLGVEVARASVAEQVLSLVDLPHTLV